MWEYASEYVSVCMYVIVYESVKVCDSLFVSLFERFECLYEYVCEWLWVRVCDSVTEYVSM